MALDHDDRSSTDDRKRGREHCRPGAKPLPRARAEEQCQRRHPDNGVRKTAYNRRSRAIVSERSQDHLAGCGVVWNQGGADARVRITQ
jgi:hypothetical protein